MVVRPIITYDIIVWWPRVEYRTSRAKLSKLQRLACLGITGTIWTAPTAAMEVLPGLPSLHLKDGGWGQGRHFMQVASCKCCSAIWEKLAWTVSQVELWSELGLRWNICINRLAQSNLPRVHAVYSKAECPSLKLCSGLGLRTSPSSLFPHPCNEHTTHQCLPFTPAAAPTFLTWPRQRIMAVVVLAMWADYLYYTFQNHCMISLLFLRNDRVGRLLVL
jgi:hypothetical protein